ncbi:MAG TPA: hypothetical protein VIX91_08185 [Candidatus Acidoferrum sp.]
MIRIGKTREIWLVATVVLCAATAVVFAESKKGNYAPSQLGILQQVAPTQLTPDASYQVSAYPAPSLDLVPGEGLSEVRIYCGTCHSPRYITMQPPLPAATWEAEVGKMNKTFGSAISDGTSRKIIAYLQTHYSTDNHR